MGFFVFRNSQDVERMGEQRFLMLYFLNPSKEPFWGANLEPQDEKKYLAPSL